MFKKFDNVLEVTEKLSGDLLERFPGATVELFLHTQDGEHPECVRGGLSLALSRLSDFCRAFPRVLVRYQPEHPYGMISTIMCDCVTPPEACPHRCQSGRERPWALLTLVHLGEAEVHAGSRWVAPHDDPVLRPSVAPVIAETNTPSVSQARYHGGAP